MGKVYNIKLSMQQVIDELFLQRNYKLRVKIRIFFVTKRVFLMLNVKFYSF